MIRLTPNSCLGAASLGNCEPQAALRQFDGVPMPAQVEPSLKTLDHSVVQIQRAIAADPKSVYLLDQLRRTYSRRLELTQRAVTG